LTSWIQSVATYNPVTPIIESSRSLIAGSYDGLLLAFVCGGALVLAFGLWAVRGMRGAEAAGG
jgi:ABC-type polysaccharide/polyol phosphate export permease